MSIYIYGETSTAAVSQAEGTWVSNVLGGVGKRKEKILIADWCGSLNVEQKGADLLPPVYPHALKHSCVGIIICLVEIER